MLVVEVLVMMMKVIVVMVMVELRGSIRVHCRIRPLLPFDSSFDDPGQPHSSVSGTVVHAVDDETLWVKCSRPGHPPVDKTYSFERVYGPAEGQDAVFEDVRPLLMSLLDGYNVCVMAHGQTGSGKSHTMLGPSPAVGAAPPAGARRDLGVIPQAAEELFRLLSENPPRKPAAEVSIVEVYNNEVFDLLTRDKAPASRTQREGKALVGATRQMVHSAAEFMSLVAGSLHLRVRHPTLVHADSSRSHLIITVTLPVATSPGSSGHPPDHPPGYVPTCPSPRPLVREKQRAVSPVFPPGLGFGGPSALLEQACTQLQFVDLAGSECAGVSGVTGPALREASCINRSLAALGDVLGALWEHRGHIPYRNSRLTHLLKDGIGGDAKLLLVLCVSPCPEHLVSTLQTLSFGARARQVQWGSAGSRGPRKPT
ncbi:kinesin-like protein KIF25 [Echinops telfairi]|uniref:Kinesin-like protein KIF25 n=1 Tax=Echinops telfairi TaxID=9371 RepID=A0AC55DFE2_ECHTE|nr:kinesin-like protein KIF25 [Echinops telfairi]